MRWSRERKIIACFFALAMLILIIVNIMSYTHTSQLFERQIKVEHSYEVLQKVRDVLTTLRDAERARRGYIITGNESYLGTYNTSLASLNIKFQQAKLVTANNPAQQRRLDVIEPLIAERVSLIKQSVDLYKRNNLDKATQITLTDKGINLHDQIWKLITQIEWEEQAILQQKRAESEAGFRKTTIVQIIGSGCSFTLLFAVYSLLHRQIIKRHRLQANLRESEQRYRNLFELNPHPLWVYDLENLKFLAVNDAAVYQYGYSRSEFLSMTIADIRPPAEVPAFLKLISQLSSGYKRIGIYKHQKKNGAIIDVEVTSHELVFKGRPARLILARDITAEKQAKEALQISEERFRQIAENIHEVFWMSDAASDQILYVNPTYEQIWGRSCESLYTNSQSLLEAVHLDDREQLITNRNKYHETEFETEYRIIRPDGSVRWIWDYTFPIRDSNGKIYRRAGVAQDITERKRAEEVRRTLEKEREMNELKMRFFSMVSHEFRTPLSTILISAQLLENSRKEWSEEKKLKNLFRIQAAAKTMTQLLTDILTLTRAEAGNLEFKPHSLNLEDFCQAVVEEIEFSTRAQQHIFFISQCQSTYACMDEKILRSIFTNLLDNAIKYSPEDSHIYFTLACEGGQAVFQIQDQGIGITAEDEEHLYEAFHRGNNVGDINGTGLGLAVVKKCVELHGGKIRAESKVGVGTSFTVTMPLNC